MQRNAQYARHILCSVQVKRTFFRKHEWHRLWMCRLRMDVNLIHYLCQCVNSTNRRSIFEFNFSIAIGGTMAAGTWNGNRIALFLFLLHLFSSHPKCIFSAEPQPRTWHSAWAHTDLYTIAWRNRATHNTNFNAISFFTIEFPNF